MCLRHWHNLRFRNFNIFYTSSKFESLNAKSRFERRGPLSKSEALRRSSLAGQIRITEMQNRATQFFDIWNEHFGFVEDLEL